MWSAAACAEIKSGYLLLPEHPITLGAVKDSSELLGSSGVTHPHSGCSYIGFLRGLLFREGITLLLSGRERSFTHIKKIIKRECKLVFCRGVLFYLVKHAHYVEEKCA